MNVGMDIEKKKVTMAVETSGGITTTMELDPEVARTIAKALTANADAIDGMPSASEAFPFFSQHR